MRLSHVAAAALALTVVTGARRARAQEPDLFNSRLLSGLTYRNLGPWRLGARIADVAVPTSPAKDHLYTFYVAPWVGGLFKTTDNGTTFQPVFDEQSTLSIGDVTIAPSNSNIVWVGTGDAYTSRSSYAGNGVYKSTDAGKSWTNMGLKETQHIARILIHPTNPNIVYVAAMGHLYSDNPERGVFRTMDGGRTWEKVLFIDDKVGVIDLVMNPRNPSVLYAATYDKTRLPWQFVNGGPGSGVYKTTDAGHTWKRLAGGFPSGRIGRIGLDLYPKNPNILYAVVENGNGRTTAAASGAGGAGAGGRGGAGRGGRGGGRGGAAPAIGGEVYRTANGGVTWTKMNSDADNVSGKGPYYFTQIRVDPNNDQHIFVTGVSLGNSIDGGKTWFDLDWPPRRLFSTAFGDVRTLWIDPENSDRMMMGSDGGIFMTYDGGKTNVHFPNLPIGSIYAVGVDMEEPYNIYGGLQDHDNWKGPSTNASGRGTTTADWIGVGSGDGMFSQVDPTDSRWLYTSLEYGGHQRVDQKLGYRTSIRPTPEPGQPPYRFLWETPIVLSPHNPSVVYTGGQFLLRSPDRGDTWKAISPDLSTNPADKILPQGEGGNGGGIPWFAISAIAESPLTAGVIWAGTADGNVQVTRDNGATWTNVTSKIAAVGGREDAFVSRIRASSHVAGRAYVAKNGWKFDDFRPYLYRTDDYGVTWKPIVGNLPNQPISGLWEDLKNPNLLFVGNDEGAFVSIDGGGRWVKMNNNMPSNVPVHDLVVHPRDNDLVLATYGRGFYVTNIAPLQEMSAGMLSEDVHLFAVQPAVERLTWGFGAGDYQFGNKHIITENKPDAMIIQYYLKAPSSDSVTVAVADVNGQTMATLRGSAGAGINTVEWNMRAGGGGRGARGGGRGSGGNPLDQWAPVGDYTVTLTAGGKRLTQRARIAKMQGWTVGPVPQTIR